MQGKYRPLWLNDNGDLEVLDQRYLPHETKVRKLTTGADATEAISDMTVRGAGVIGNVFSAATVTLSDMTPDIGCSTQHDILHDFFVQCRCRMQGKIFIAMDAEDIGHFPFGSFFGNILFIIGFYHSVSSCTGILFSAGCKRSRGLLVEEIFFLVTCK